MKALLVDADGVALKRHEEYFSTRFAREYGVPIEELIEFFKGDFRLTQRNKADLKKLLEPLLPRWNWSKGVDEYLSYWFTNDCHPDEDVLARVAALRARGVKCYLATDQEKYRASYIRDTLSFSKVFDGTFFSYEVGHTKDEPQFFEHIAKTLSLEPHKISYIDDDEKNVAVAKSVGVDGRYYQSLEDFPKE